MIEISEAIEQIDRNLESLGITLTDDYRRLIRSWVKEIQDIALDAENDNVPKETIAELIAQEKLPELLASLGITISDDGPCDICGDSDPKRKAIER